MIVGGSTFIARVSAVLLRAGCIVGRRRTRVREGGQTYEKTERGCRSTKHRCKPPFSRGEGWCGAPWREPSVHHDFNPVLRQRKSNQHNADTVVGDLPQSA